MSVCVADEMRAGKAGLSLCVCGSFCFSAETLGRAVIKNEACSLIYHGFSRCLPADLY